MHLLREKRPLFFILFFIIGSQIVSAQNNPASPFSIERKIASVAEIKKNAAASPSLSAETRETESPANRWKVEKKNRFEEFRKTEIKDIKNAIREIKSAAETGIDFRGDEIKQLKKISAKKRALPDNTNDPDDASAPAKREGFNWRGALTQSFIFIGIQHGYAVLGQAKTRRALKGNFWRDYVDSVKSIHGWDDGGRFFTNYIAHPMQGSLTGYIYVQNSPQARRQEFGKSRAYWTSRMKAMLWSAAWSTQFEIGPISQASIGNVGQSGKQTWEDIVVTPTLGTAMLITEEAIDRYLIKSIERRMNNFYIKIFSRMILNPVRIFSNLLRFKQPWYRDRPAAR